MIRELVARALAVLVVACVPATGGAQPAPTPFSGVDLVVVIDQSGSMWGNPAVHPGKNDPWQHRIGATKSVILRLIEHVSGTPFVHHVSVVDFDNNAQVTLSNEEIRFDGANPAALDRIKARLETAVAAKDGGNTNTAIALEAAVREFDKMARGTPAAGRRRTLLLITDGRPTAPGIADADMRSRIRAQFAALDKASVQSWVVGLNDADNYWNSGEGTFWEGLAGADHARLAESASTALPSVFQDIVDGWLDMKSTLLRGNEYDCPPYLRRVVFNVTFSRPRGEIRIVDPDGRDVPRTGGGPPVSPGTFAHFAIDDPKPGIYKIVRDPTRADIVHVEEYSPSIERLVPIAADSQVDTRVVFQARNAAGQPLALLSDTPIAAAVVVTGSTGAPSDLGATSTTDGKFEARWRPPAPGRYQLTLRGLIRRADGSEYDVFAHDAGTYDRSIDVGTRRPHWLRLVDPDPVSGVRTVPWSSSSKVRFELLDETQKRVESLNGVVRDPASWLSVQSLDARGNPLGAAVRLAEESPGAFLASIPVQVAWTSGEGWRVPGTVSLRITAQPERLLGDRYLNSLLLPADLEERRVASDPLSVGPIRVRLALWIWIAVTAVLLIGIVAVVWGFLLRWIPAAAIRRQDTAKRRRVVLKIYDEAADPAGTSAQEFPLSGGRAFKFDGRMQLDVAGQMKKAERLRVMRRPTSGKAAGVLLYRWNGDRKDRPLQLTTGAPRAMEGLPTRTIVAQLVEIPLN